MSSRHEMHQGRKPGPPNVPRGRPARPSRDPGAEALDTAATGCAGRDLRAGNGRPQGIGPGMTQSGSDRAADVRNGHRCGGCSAVWSALGAAHCAKCHRTFAGVTLFDAHRWQYGERGACEDPERIGQSFRNGLWRGPEMTAEEKTRFGRRL